MRSVAQRTCVLLTVAVSDGAEALYKPSAPTLCTQENQGRCDCGNLDSDNLKTFTWWINDQQRCYTAYSPTNTLAQHPNEQTPVVMYLDCYGKDRVTGNTKLESCIQDAERFGMSLVYASSPTGNWAWAGAVSNSSHPMTCDSSAIGGSDDYTYFEDIFAHLSVSLPNHNPDQVFTYGFSQNGMGAGYVGSCFMDKVTGAWRGGAGLFLKDGSGGPVPPHKEGNCSTCAHWPSYPCFQGIGKRPLRDCAMDYDNDPLTAFNATDNHPMGLYKKGVLEGADVRVVVFKSEEHPPGGHRPPAFGFDWAMGCMGLRDQNGQCSAECATALKSCVAGGQDYGTCIQQTSACPQGCTPTWEMLTQSETPYLHTTNENGFGAPTKAVCKNSRLATSICTYPSSKVRDCLSSDAVVV